MGTAALFGMQQPPSYGLVGCFQERLVLETPGQAGHGQPRRDRGTCPFLPAEPGACAVSGGRESAELFTPPSAAPLHSPVYIPVNLFERQKILPASHITPPLMLSGDFCWCNSAVAFPLHSPFEARERRRSSKVADEGASEQRAPAPAGRFRQRCPAVPVPGNTGTGGTFCCQRG